MPIVKLADRKQNVSIRMVRSLSDMKELGPDWDALVNHYGHSPWYLRPFMERYMDLAIRERGDPVIIALTVAGRLEGFVAATPKSYHGLKYLKSFYAGALTQDLVCNPEYRDVFLTAILDCAFGDLRCQFLELFLPAESECLQSLSSRSQSEGFSILQQPHFPHAVIPVEASLDEFLRDRGRPKLGKEMRRTERILDELGDWEVRTLQVSTPDAREGISKVEAVSWKDAWHERTGIADRDLPVILDCAGPASVVDPLFSARVWFLELDGEPVAYTVVLQYKDTAFFAKNSYDNEFRKASPGVFLRNFVIREMFLQKSITKIDFLTALGVHDRWGPSIEMRTRVLIARKGWVIPLVRLGQSRVGSTLVNVLSRIVPHSS